MLNLNRVAFSSFSECEMTLARLDHSHDSPRSNVAQQCSAPRPKEMSDWYQYTYTFMPMVERSVILNHFFISQYQKWWLLIGDQGHSHSLFWVHAALSTRL